MKIFTYIIFILAIILIGFNVYRIDFKNPFQGESLIAVIGVLSTLCGIVILLIFNISKSIEKKLKN